MGLLASIKIMNTYRPILWAKRVLSLPSAKDSSAYERGQDEESSEYSATNLLKEKVH